MKKHYLILTSILFLSSCSFSVGDYSYSNGKNYTSASELTMNEDIKTIKFNWISGNVIIKQSLDNSFSFKEESSNEKYPMHYWLNDDVLNIHFVKNGTLQNEINNLIKNVELFIPASLEKLEFDIVESDLLFNNLLTLEKLEIDSVDGEINIENMNIQEVNIDRVDGNLLIQNIESSDNVNIDIDSVDGEDIIYIQEDMGYKVNFDSISNKFESEYDSKMEYGAKKVEIDYDSVDGKLKIMKR